VTKRNKIIMALGLLGVMAFMWVQMLAGTGKANASDAAAPKSAVPAAQPVVAPRPTASRAADAPASEGLLSLQQRRRKLPWKRDPFRVPVQPTQQDTASGEPGSGQPQYRKPEALIEVTCQLNAILYSANSPMASIDGQVMSVGGTTPDGAKIVEITEQTVVVVKQGKRFVLTMDRDK